MQPVLKDQKRKFCFCTLALGQTYVNLAKQLANDLRLFSPESVLMVLTDQPQAFNLIGNVLVVRHRAISVLGYNDKLCVIKKGLELFNTCVFLDSDMRILAPVLLNIGSFRPGIEAYRIRSWDYTVKEAEAMKQNRVARNDLRIMDLLRKRLDLQLDDKDIPYPLEFLFAVTRNDKTHSFLEKWNDLAEFCEKNRMYIHEGFSIGLAAMLTGCPISQNGFEGLQFFEERIWQKDLADGLISPTDYHPELLESIVRHKYPPVPEKSTINKIIDKYVRKLRHVLRVLKIRVFGLNLIQKNSLW